MVAHFDSLVKSIPGMGKKLLNTESDAFLLIVEVKDNDFDILVELNNFAGIRYTAPREVGDVYETVNTAESTNTP